MRRIAALVFASVVSVRCAPLATVGEPGPPGGAPERRFDFAILEDYDKGDDIAAIRRDFASFKDLGITTWRGSLGWDDFEPEEGRFDFKWLDQFVSAAEVDGITLRPYIGYTPAWASGGGTDGEVWNDPPASLDQWSAFVRALVSALGRHRNVVSLEIYNEENVPQWWDGTASQYREVLERAAREIRAASPRLQVILGGMVFPDTQWLDQICGGRAAATFDILPFHAYPETWTPADVDLERYLGPWFESGFVRAADAACGRRPIWVNETGFATIDGVSEEAQAGWWARAVATFASEPRIEHVGVYEIKDLAPDREAIGGTPNYHLGLERADGTRKLGFATVKMLAGLFNGGRFEVVPPRVERRENTPEQSDIFARGFRLADGRQLLVLWAKRASVRVDVTLSAPGSVARERLLNGDARSFAPFDGTTLREVDLAPGAVRIFEIDSRRDMAMANANRQSPVD